MKAFRQLSFPIVFLALAAPAQAAETPPPAGGAALGQVAIATLAASILTVALLWLGFGYRAGRIAWLERLAKWSERVSGHPRWMAIPSAVAAISLLIAVFGMYWDIALHIGVGRDEGPLANPAHYFILAGLFGIFAAGWLAIVLPQERPSGVAVRLGPDWWAPLGGILICACGAFSLVGFPLDDVWHRLFGQDVTLWGPTHLMLIGGAAMRLIGIAVLSVEGLRANATHSTPLPERRFATLARGIALTGGLMLGLSTFQAEFDFGVPQFRLVFGPLLIMLAAGVGLVAARLYGGRGAALGAVAFFVLIRGILALLIDPGLGETTPHFPLYIVEALVVEAIGLRLGADRPLAFGLWAGLGLGTVGLAAEWGWSHIWMPLPWPAELFPEGAVVGFAAAMSGSLLGAWIGTRLAVEPRPPHPGLRQAAVAGAALLAAMVAFSLYTPAEQGTSARVVLSEAGGSGGRAVNASVTMRPRDAAEGAEWLQVTAWQGDGLVVAPLERTAPGRYRTTEPVPVDGNWKAMIRLHEGSSLTALPIFLPRDEAIPVGEVPAAPAFTRRFVDEHSILQREQTGGSAPVVIAAYAAVISITLGLLTLLVWALHRLAFGAPSARSRMAPHAGGRPGTPPLRGEAV